MPRNPRFVFQNAFYHVFNRGLNKQPIFIKEDDYNFFLEKLYHLKKKYDYSIYALCLMPNHFHLSIQTRKDSISKIMASLGTSYSMYFNRIYNHFGPVFQNRFKSILVENDDYFLKLSQYIYLNPVKDGLINDPLKYKYSSLREALGKEPLYFLDKDFLGLVGETEKDRKEYEKFIFDGLDGIENNLSEIEKLFEASQDAFGTNKFSTFAQRKYLKRRQK